jgi:DNA-binding XRE family transcriptional regulator/quercetin dioxygenase-like cupin family protein
MNDVRQTTTADSGLQDVVRPIARNVRRLREQMGLSLSALAQESGVSKSTLSQLERGGGNPSVDTLWSLARVLGVPFAALFEETHPSALNVLRFADAPLVGRSGRGATVARSGHGFSMRHVLSRHGRGELEVYVVDLESGGRRSAAPHTAGVIEHALVVSGAIDVGAEGESALLGPGDRISFPADRQHHYEAVNGPARAIAILDYP